MRKIFLLALLIGSLSPPVLVAEQIPTNLNLSSPASNSLSNSSKPIKPKISRDAYYKVEGPVSGPRAPRLTEASYPTEFGESRVVVWIVAQQHLYWSGFVVGALLLVTMLEVIGLMGWGSGHPQSYDRFATEIFRFIVLALGMAAGLGGFLFVCLLVLYPDLMMYLTTVFRPVFLLYGALVIGFTLLTYGYYYFWERMKGGLAKWLHASLGVMVNVVGIVLTMIGNAWSSFMLSPAGVTEQGAYLGNIWHVLHTALWNPLNVHRIASHILLGAAVVMVYGAYRAMTAQSFEERQHYDWLSCVTFACGVVALITMPFGGYWLFREIYAYRQQMGITNFGGLLAWLNVVLVTAMGLLFFAINYYLWQRIDAVGGSPHYGRYAKYVYAILSLCMMVSVTPHTIVMTPLELQQMGGQQHQVLGNFGVESAKMAAVNIMIVMTLWSWILWRRCYVQEQAMRQQDWFLTAAFLMGTLNILALGIYGYFIPANVRIGLQIPMVLTPFSLFVLAMILCPASTVPSNRSVQWGTLSSRGYGAIIFLAFVVTWIMGLGGYRRSSTRLFWHINDVMRDQSPWAFTHSIGFATNIISLNALVFWFGIGFIFWMARRNREEFQNVECEAKAVTSSSVNQQQIIMSLLNRMKFYWSKGWVKALVIALPATVLFGLAAFLGFYAGLMGIVWTLDGTYGEWKSSVDYFDVRMMLQGLGGLLGLLGAWIAFLGQNRLQRSVSYLNWFVGFLLLAGVGSVLWLVFMNGWASAYRSMTRSIDGFLIMIGFLTLTGYGLYLAISLVRKRAPTHTDSS